ncbi:MAG: pirin family protein [Salibacter sp.]|uniref:pirin family protein n=1 Tax=Salibacter sp. TaxID=2010995 RepID=UPI0028704DB9|nr:pirin family protein [Salibacter sp.]MDR9398066.1 pirin family protein [Salibacter sp.]
MSAKNDRRSFLSKLTVGTTAVLTWPFSGVTRSGIVNDQKSVDVNPIKNIKPLGFNWETPNPFLFCVHHDDQFPQGNENMGPDKELLKGRDIGNDFIIKDGFRMYHGTKVPGFPGHPHRGFETITLVREGLIDHADSLGAAGRYGFGDVQWMTAGEGVQHSEMFPLINEEKENPLELFQIWLNLPRKSKMVKPHFKMMWKEDQSKYSARDENGNKIKAEVIAGKLGDVEAPAPPPDSWAADKNNHVGVWNIVLNPNAKWTLPKAPKGVNRTVYFYVGKSITVAGKEVPRYHSIEVEPDVDLPIINHDHVSRILVLQGRPIDEPVIQYGPFVMNSKEEIQQAFKDYQQTQFGGWPWPRRDQIHDRNEGRFAIHADGRKEVKG